MNSIFIYFIKLKIILFLQKGDIQFFLDGGK